MNKEEYRRVLRDRLRKVPVILRRHWEETDLMTWWNQERHNDANLRWDHASADPWENVKGMCSDLIGPNAE
jgi:hypothetical protein